MKPTNLFKQSFFTFTIIVLSQLLAGCFTYEPMLSSKADKAIDKSEIAALVTPGRKYKINPSPSIASGNFIIITVKNGEKIKFKVTAADSAKITGIHYSWNNSKGAYDHLDKTIMIQDIQSIRKRKFSAEKTVGLVITVTLGLILLYGLKPYWGLLN